MTKESYITRLQRQVKEFQDYTNAVQELRKATHYAKCKNYNRVSVRRMDAAEKVEREKFKIIEPYLAE